MMIKKKKMRMEKVNKVKFDMKKILTLISTNYIIKLIYFMLNIIKHQYF